MKTTYTSKLILLFSFFFILTDLISQDHQNSQKLPNQIVVRLNFKLLNFEAVNDRTLLTGNLRTFLNPEGIGIADKLNESDINFNELMVHKMFPNILTSDSISISRLGSEVTVPPFWATFNIELPKGLDFWSFYKVLNKKYPLVIYADPPIELIFDSIPNDSLFQYQQSLYYFSNPNASINLDSAWNIETGRNFIKVGVFDSGIDSSHVDLNILTGKSYYDDLILDTVTLDYYHDFGTDNHGHGTLVAGIIGARRNNGIGIAGIAGGNGSDTSGISLVDFKLGFSEGGTAENFSAAIIDAARSVGTYYDWNQGPPDATHPTNEDYWDHTSGFGINIGNHSYGYKVVAEVPPGGGKNLPNSDTLHWEPILETPFCNLCRESFLFSLQNGVVNVVSRGNNLDVSPGADATEPNNRYPQKYDDSWIITVGASGTDGNRVYAPGNTDVGESYQSPVGQNVDVLAPGSRANVVSTRSSNLPDTDIYGYYRVFNGTSASAPHVSGVVALLLSYYNKPCYSNINLDPADVEYILQRSATDVNPNVIGYDDSTGYGRINAYQAIKMIDFPEYQIVHPNELPTVIQLNEVDTISLNLDRPLNQEYYGPLSSQFPLELQRNYKVERRKYQLTYDISNYVFPSTQLIDTWVRHGQTNSLGFINDTVGSIELVGMSGNYEWVSRPDTFRIEPMCTIDTLIINPTTKLIKLSGYYYHFMNKYLGGTSIDDNVLVPGNEDFWYPINPDSIPLKMAFSLYLQDSTFQDRFDFPCTSDNVMFDTLMTVNEISKIDITLYPNPSSNELNVLLGDGLDGHIEIVNLSGQLVLKERINQNKKHYSLNVNNLESGIYFVNLVGSNNLTITKKWIKL